LLRETPLQGSSTQTGDRRDLPDIDLLVSQKNLITWRTE